jgi:glucose-6-phosphate isomerase
MIEQLELHYQNNPEPRIEDLFKADPHRLDKYSIRLDSGSNFLFFDFSKNILDDHTLQMLHALALEKNIFSKIQDMFNGEKINTTENRAVLHIALRNRSNRPIYVDGQGILQLHFLLSNINIIIIIFTIINKNKLMEIDVMGDVNAVLEKMKGFIHRVRSGEWKGYTGKAIRDVINIGFLFLLIYITVYYYYYYYYHYYYYRNWWF